jgi:hypothetical protein
MKIIDGYSIFDWLEIISNAQYIVTVETASCYLVEYLKYNNRLTSKQCYMTTKFKNPEDGWNAVNGVYSDFWIQCKNNVMEDELV